MFDPTSRYADRETRVHVADDGREIRHVARRFLPDGSDQPLLGDVTVRQDDRLDLIAHRTLGDAGAWWRVADANEAMDPTALTERAGDVLRVAVPQPDPDA
ncbi:MAG: hypothetical protein AAF772_14080 [Acidobacteriota bacterium]